MLTVGFRGSTVGDVYRKVMGDAPLAYVETVGAVRVGEDDLVAVGKNDVSDGTLDILMSELLTHDFRSCHLRSAEHNQPLLAGYCL